MSEPPVTDNLDENDWAKHAVDSLENFVGAIRSKTTEPIQKAVKVAVYGLMAVGVVFMIFLLLTVASVRFLDWFLPVWGAYLVLAGIFLGIGWFCLRKARK